MFPPEKYRYPIQVTVTTYSSLGEISNICESKPMHLHSTIKSIIVLSPID